MITLIYAPEDAASARRIEADLAGFDLPAAADALIVLLSPAAHKDLRVQQAITDAADRSRRVVPVLVEDTTLPRLIEHLPVVDFTTGYDAEELRAALLDSAEALHMKVLTPAARARNQRTAAIFVVIALAIFLMGVYMIGVLGLRPPSEEYDAVETEIILTRNYFVDEVLPRTTQEAESFPATVDAARPSLQPVLAATATARAGTSE